MVPCFYVDSVLRRLKNSTKKYELPILIGVTLWLRHEMDLRGDVCSISAVVAGFLCCNSHFPPPCDVRYQCAQVVPIA